MREGSPPRVVLPQPYQLAGHRLEWLAGLACCLSLVAVFLADVLTPSNVLLTALALFPILFAAWTMSASLAVVVPVVAALLLSAEAVLGSGNAITVGVEITVYSALAIAARLHARGLTPASSPEPAEPNPIENLTKRERQVVTLAARGLTASEMAELLYISERTVETHLANAYPKLGVRSKTELVRQAHLLGV